MDAALTIIDQLHIRRLELFMDNVITTINEKNEFSKFFKHGKLYKTPQQTNQSVTIDIAGITFDERNLRRTFHLDIFERSTLHFAVVLRATPTGYSLSLNWADNDRTFPPNLVVRSLGIRRVDIHPHIFAILEVNHPYDPTALNTFLSNKVFAIALELPICDIVLRVQRDVYSLKYREVNVAGYSNLNMPHLDLTETAIIDASIHASSQYHRRVDRHTYDNSYEVNNRRRRLLTEPPDSPPPYDAHVLAAQTRNGAPAVNRPVGAEQQTDGVDM